MTKDIQKLNTVKTSRLAAVAAGAGAMLHQTLLWLMTLVQFQQISCRLSKTYRVFYPVWPTLWV